MSTDIEYEPHFLAGVEIGGTLKKMKVPVSAGTPGGAAQGWLWLDTTGPVQLTFHDGTSAVVIPLPGVGGLTQEQVEDFIALMIADNADLDWTYTDNGAGAGTLVALVKNDAITYAKLQNISATARVLGRKTAGAGDAEELTAADVRTLLGALDADTLGGQSNAALQAAVVNSIVAGAGAAWDTLLEIKAFIQSDESTAAALAATVALKPRFVDMAIPNGGPTGNIDHNWGLAQQGAFYGRCYVAATGATEEYKLDGTTANRVVVTSETGGNIPAGRRIFLVGAV